MDLSPSIEEIIIHTGQHYDENMSAVFLKQLNIPEPRYFLGVGSDTHGKQTARMLSEIETILYKEKPDAVLVYGDTNSTLAGSLAAAKLNIPVAHVEAGLRSFNRRMPEEINRVLTDHVSALLFCPTQTAVDHLYREGIQEGVHLVGDIMYDAVLYYNKLAMSQSAVLDDLGLFPDEYYLATIHRSENTDDPNRLRQILQTLGQLDHRVVFPLHPRTKKFIEKENLQDLLHAGNIRAVDPVNYFDMLVLETRAKLILTDSGGVQKEAYMVQVPCITLRDETEWEETVLTGWNHVTGTNPANVMQAIANIKIPPASPNIFGDGTAGRRIERILLQLFQ
jgi:UDP-N-acetylglucosamine 2-epimerase